MKNPSLPFTVTVTVTAEVDEQGAVSWLQEGLADAVRVAIEKSSTVEQRITMRERHNYVVQTGAAIAADIASQWVENMKQHMKNIEAERIELVNHRPFDRNSQWIR